MSDTDLGALRTKLEAERRLNDLFRREIAAWVETSRTVTEYLRDLRESQRMLRDAWNAHMETCPQHAALSVPSFDEIQKWMDAPSDTASALSSDDATRPTGDKSGPEDGQSDTVPMKRPVMEGVDPAATDSGHVGASTYVWLIERGQAEHQEPTVWATKTGPMTWSQDPWAAIRFQTEAAAESFIAEHLTHPTRGPSARVVQHGFSRPTGDKE